MLTGVEEVLDIARGSDEGLRGTRVSGEPVTLDGDEQVSMNLWGFTPAVFPLLRKQFAAFLREGLGDCEAEFLIPAAAAQQMREGRATYRVLPTSAGWFGLTFPKDTEVVRRRVAELHARSDYPDRLAGGIA
jgi:hypothetical protein